MVLMSKDWAMVLVNVTVMRYFRPLLVQLHSELITAVGAGPETANAGAATLTAAIGTVQATPRATARRVTCGEDMRSQLPGGVEGPDPRGPRRSSVATTLTVRRP